MLRAYCARHDIHRPLASVLFIAALVLGSTLLATPAAAGEFALYGAYWDTDELDDAVGVGGKLALGEGTLGFEVRAAFYEDLTRSLGEIFEDDEEPADDFEVEAIPLDAGVHVRLGPPSRTHLFVAGGVSYILLDTNVFDIDDEVGFYASVGLKTGGEGLGFYADAMYRDVEGTVDAGGDLIDLGQIDLDLSGLNVHAGLAWGF